MFSKKWIAFILTILAAALPAAVWAHSGGTSQLNREPAGPFMISAWTLPETLEVGEINLIILVTTRGESGVDDYILDADVRVTLTNRDSGETKTVTATHEDATNKLFYESYTEIESEGRWQTEIAVQSGGETGSAGFSFEVGEVPAGTSWPIYAAGAAVIASAAGLWLFGRRRTSQGEKAGEALDSPSAR